MSNCIEIPPGLRIHGTPGRGTYQQKSDGINLTLIIGEEGGVYIRIYQGVKTSKKVPTPIFLLKSDMKMK